MYNMEILRRVCRKNIYDNQEPCDNYYPESREQNAQRVTRLCFMNIQLYWRDRVIYF